MDAGDSAAWLAVGLFPLTGFAGWFLRRFLSGAFVTRLRPHYLLGYAVLGLGAFHGMLAMGKIETLSGPNVWLASVAMVGLALQAFVGLSLQAPGIYRAVLRRWHFAIMWSAAIFITGHVLLTL
jgi:Ni,Fe-hydrogenase I cytochrome b subunit